MKNKKNMKKLFFLGCLSLLILGAQAQQRSNKSTTKSETFKIINKNNPYKFGFENEFQTYEWNFLNDDFCLVWWLQHGALIPCPLEDYMWLTYSNSELEELNVAATAFEGTTCVGILGNINGKEVDNYFDELFSPWFICTDTGEYVISFRVKILTPNEDLNFAFWNYGNLKDPLREEPVTVSSSDWELKTYTYSAQTNRDTMAFSFFAYSTVASAEGILIDSVNVYHKSSATGIQKTEITNINVYPNPITHILTIQTDRSYDITVSDISGRVVLQQKLMDEKSTLDFSNYQSGMYFIQFRNADEIKTIKIVKE